MPAVTPIRAVSGRAGSLRDGGRPSGPLPPRQAPLPGQVRAGQQGRTGALRVADEEAEVRAITRGTVQAAMEVLAGVRPVHQLARRLDPRCLSSLQHRAALIRREIARTANPALEKLNRNSLDRSVRYCEDAEDTYESSAVVDDDVRARAVAVRLERTKQVWRITELVIG